MRVLVAYGSKRGGTAGLARVIGGALRGSGLEADVRSAGEVGDPGGYDAVVVGGALYGKRWHRHARRFVKRHARALSTKPVWFFSSGPLDDSAARKSLPPVRSVARLMARVGARDHATFGGRLEKNARGVLAALMARRSFGDWRDPERAHQWAVGIARELRPRVPSRPAPPAQRPAPPPG